MIDRVALFVTCLADTLFPQVGKATVTVLERLGIEVVFPAEQTCCGQMHANSGYPGEAELLARRFVEVFDGFDAIVTPSGSCAAQVREHVPGLLGGDDRGVPARTWELSQFLTGVLGRRGRRLDATRARSPTTRPATRCGSCASATRRCGCCAPCPGVELVELPDAEECCGFGGTFAVKNADVSAAMLDEKLAAVVATGADAVCACDSSCLMHIGGGLRRRGIAVRPRASGGDPRVVSGAAAATRAARELPAGGAGCAREPRRCGPTSATRRARSAPSAPPSWPRCPTGRRCARPERRSRTTTLARLDAVLVELEASVEAAGGHGPLGARRGRGERDRRSRSSGPRAPTRS